VDLGERPQVGGEPGAVEPAPLMAPAGDVGQAAQAESARGPRTSSTELREDLAAPVGDLADMAAVRGRHGPKIDKRALSRDGGRPNTDSRVFDACEVGA